MGIADYFQRRSLSQREITQLEAQLRELQARVLDAERLRGELQDLRLQQSSASRKHDVQTVLVSLIAVVAALIGTFLATSAARGDVDRAIKAEGAREERQKKGEVYLAYLAAATAYQAEVVRQFNPRFPPTDDPDRPPLLAAWNGFKAKRDLLLVYGSKEAWQAHLAIAAALPVIQPEGVPATGEFLMPEEFITHPPPGSYAGAYAQFRDVFCKEALPQQRDGCAP